MTGSPAQGYGARFRYLAEPALSALSSPSALSAPSGAEADVGPGGPESARPGTAQPGLAAQSSPQGAQEQRQAEGSAAAADEASASAATDEQQAGIAEFVAVRRRLKRVSRQFVVMHGRKPVLADMRSGSTMFPDDESRRRVKTLTNQYLKLRKQYRTIGTGDL